MQPYTLLSDRKYAPVNLGRVLILGLGKSGKAVAQYCLNALGDRVQEVVIYAGKATLAAEAWAEEARRRGARIYFDVEDVEGTFDLGIVSPGISDHSSFYQSGKSHVTELISEVEFAWRESSCASRWVAITGTNGKTTTTALTTHLLHTAGFEASAVGNIGDTCIDAVAAGLTDVYVVEVSSYQLASTIRFAPDVAVVLNITPDHLSWHGSFEAYEQAKWRILKHFNERFGTAVLNMCDPEVRRWVEQRGVETLGFDSILLGGATGIGEDARHAQGVTCAAFRAAGGRLNIAHGATVYDLVFVDDLQIKGEHNQQNALAAASAALVLGATKTALVEGLLSFAPLEHRIEFAGTVDGISVYNDSKATNVDATLVAVKAFLPQRPTILLGGRDKGTDLAPLVESCQEYAACVVCFGEAKDRFYDAFEKAGYTPLFQAEGLEEALDKALSVTPSGEVIVLSPACASFDEFSCFEERGDVFKSWVAQRAEASQVHEAKE